MENALRGFYDLPQLPDSKIFSPLHSQLMNELGSPYLHSPTTFSNDNNGVQFQCHHTISGDIAEFLDSILVSSDEDSATHHISGVESETPKFAKDSGSCSESDVEVAQGQV